ncbi:MAG: DUF2007 domain-containing protein [Bacteroidales bacterium]|nr:DUF2007 domain-containing protein [Bacteroidales bacterium]
MKNKKESDLTIVYEGLKWEAEVIKGLLESNGIKCTINTTIAVFSPYGDYNIQLLVLNEDAEKAKELIANKNTDTKEEE